MSTPPNPTAAAGPQPSAIQTSPNLVAFDPKNAVPQQPLYMQRNDVLLFFPISNITGCVLQLNYRWLTPAGEIKEGQFVTAPFTGSMFFNIPLYEGWLLSFAARVIGGVGIGTWTFLQAFVARAAIIGGTFTAHSLFWQGFIPQSTPNGWPGTPAKEITDGPGVIRSITGTTPGAGADISETVPLLRRWSLITFFSTLTASAAVATRIPVLFIDDGINNFYGVQSVATIAASQSSRFVWSTVGLQSAGGQGTTQNPIPGVTPLKQNFRIRTSTLALQAGDQWSTPQYEVLEWGAWDP